MSVRLTSRRHRRSPPVWVTLSWLTLALFAPDSLAASSLASPPGEDSDDVALDESGESEPPVDIALPSTTLEARSRAELRQAEIYYRATRIDVREDDTGEIGFFLGDSKVKLGGADFFDRVGREDLAAEFRTSAGVLNLVTLGGLSTALVSEGLATGALLVGFASPALFGTEGDGGTAIMLSLATSGLVLAVAGIAVGIGAMGFDPSPTTTEVSIGLAHGYNRRLRRELRLTENVLGVANGSAPAPGAASTRSRAKPSSSLFSVTASTTWVPSLRAPVRRAPNLQTPVRRAPLFAANAEFQE